MKAKRIVKAFTFFSLSTKEKHLFLRAYLLNIYYRLYIKKQPFHHALKHVELKAQQNLRQQPSDISARRITQLITTASRYVPSSTCLSTAFTGKILLAQYGYQSTLHIGVKKDTAKGFEAHAWITLDGEVVLCRLPDMGKYTTIPLDKITTK